MKKLMSGKVRDIYEINEKEFVIVTTDRISAFDVILPSPVERKGIYLNQISNFWFNYTKNIVPNHIISTEIINMPDMFKRDKNYYENRTVLVKKLKMIPYEFVVRGYMAGSMWKAYKSGQSYCGIDLTGDHKLAEELPEPIITPSVKIENGHDEFISMSELYNKMDKEELKMISDICFKLYTLCNAYTKERGIIIADTKFEFGYDDDGKIILGDEIFTPDSSRFWDLENYHVGESPKSYDKQFLRDWLIKNKLDGVSPGPELPKEIIDITVNLYRNCYEKIVLNI
jgi:phosphoribosylaminoimidazole-succinocarboxamide synthase